MPNRFSTIKELNTKSGRRYYKNVIYPEIPVTEDDIYVITSDGDRYDILAKQFYGNISFWWVIAVANTSKKDGLLIEPGIQLRIPADATAAVGLFEELNKNR